MTAFNARAARAKRPLPLWIDSIITDTQHLEADEYGVYIRLLGAMWRRESCDLPLDERRLATIGGVSPRLWRSRIGPAVLPFFDIDGGTISDRRLKAAAAKADRIHPRDPNDRRPIERGDREEIFERDGHRCAYCGTPSGPFEIDHVHPWSRGGGNEPGNLVTACRPCNRSKGAKTLEEWRT